MNNEDEAIDFLLGFYEPCEEYIFIDDFLEAGAFGHFDSDHLSRKVADAARRRFGQRSVRKRGKDKRMGFHLKCRVDLSEGTWIASWKSPNFTTTDEVEHYPSGSKICMTKESTAAGNLLDIYVHTGIVLHVGGESYVVELEKSDGAPRMVLNRAADSLRDLSRSVSVDNTYLLERGICLKDLLYRLSRIVYAPIEYDATRLNCNVLSTYLATGNIQWITMTCLCYDANRCFPKFHMKIPNVRTKT